MAINNRTRQAIVDDLTTTNTTERDFQDGTIDLITQVDLNEIDLAASRTLTLTGDVAGTATFDLSADAARGISVATTVQAMSVSGGDIASDTITATQIAGNTITRNEIAAGTLTSAEVSNPQLLRILNTAGTPIFQMRGFQVT